MSDRPLETRAKIAVKPHDALGESGLVDELVSVVDIHELSDVALQSGSSE